MSHMEWTGRIRRYKLDIHRAALTCARASVRFAGGNQRPQPLGKDIGRNAEVDEARARDLRRTDSSACKIQSLDQRLSEVTRLFPERLGEHHRHVRRPVAECGIARALDDRLDSVWRAERERRTHEFRAQQFSPVHHLSDFGVEEPVVVLGALLGFDSLDLDSLDFDSLDFDSLDFDSLDLAAGAAAAPESLPFAAGAASPALLSGFGSPPESPPDLSPDPTTSPVPRCAFLP
jgi:hypothetical protein